MYRFLGAFFVPKIFFEKIKKTFKKTLTTHQALIIIIVIITDKEFLRCVIHIKENL